MATPIKATIKITCPIRNPAGGLALGDQLTLEASNLPDSFVTGGAPAFFRVATIAEDYVELEQAAQASLSDFPGKTAVIDGISYQILNGQLVRQT